MLENRLVEPKLFPHQFDLLRGGTVVTAHCQRLGRIYRGQVGIKESQDRDAKQDKHQQTNPCQQFFSHTSALTSLLFRSAIRHDSADLLEQTKFA